MDAGLAAAELELPGRPAGHEYRAEEGRVYIVHVHVAVKPESVEEFRTATLMNARGSVEELGVARFDVLEQLDDPTRFLLVEVYRTPEDADRHRETRHYQAWRDTVAEMMAEARTSVKYANLFPRDAGWG